MPPPRRARFNFAAAPVRSAMPAAPRKVGVHRRPRHAQLRRPRATRSRRFAAALLGLGRAARGARAAADARHHRLAGGVPRLRCTPASSRSRSTRCSPPTTTRTCSSTAARRRRSCRRALAAGARRARWRRRAHEVRARDRRRGPTAPLRRRRDRLRRASLAASAPLPSPRPTAADDIAFWLYSSGSTGRPKGTVHTHANPYWTAELYGKRVLGLTRVRRLLLGGEAVLRLRPRQCADVSARRRRDRRADGRAADAGCGVQALGGSRRAQPTVFFGAPTGFAGMLASPDLPARDQVALRLCSSAGEALPARSASASPRTSAARSSTASARPRCCTSSSPIVPATCATARPASRCPATRSSCAATTAGRCADGEIGDLYINGPSAALLYWGNREKTRETFQGAWTKSGDKYVRDADGYYTYAGRSDDMLKVSGSTSRRSRSRPRWSSTRRCSRRRSSASTDADGLDRPRPSSC